MGNKTGVINDPLGQTHNHKSRKHYIFTMETLFSLPRFWKVGMDGRTDDIYEKNDHYLRRLWFGRVDQNRYRMRRKIFFRRKCFFFSQFLGVKRYLCAWLFYCCCHDGCCDVAGLESHFLTWSLVRRCNNTEPEEIMSDPLGQPNSWDHSKYNFLLKCYFLLDFSKWTELHVCI